MIQISLLNVGVKVESDPHTGVKVLYVMDEKSGVSVVVPLPPDVARQVGTALISSVAIASGSALDQLRQVNH